MSHDENGGRCGLSSVGESLDFLAPGENIRTTVKPLSYVVEPTYEVIPSGTSLAVPFVCAVVAHVLEEAHVIFGTGMLCLVILYQYFGIRF